MSYDTNNINLNILNQYKSSFLAEKNNFTNSTYNTFLSSHLNSSNNTYVKLMSTKLDNLYREISNSYDSLLKWFDDYIQNANSLELSLSGDFNPLYISDSILRNYVDNKLSGKLNRKIENISYFNIDVNLTDSSFIKNN